MHYLWHLAIKFCGLVSLNADWVLGADRHSGVICTSGIGLRLDWNISINIIIFYTLVRISILSNLDHGCGVAFCGPMPAMHFFQAKEASMLSRPDKQIG